MKIVNITTRNYWPTN